MAGCHVSVETLLGSSIPFASIIPLLITRVGKSTTLAVVTLVTLAMQLMPLVLSVVIVPLRRTR